MENKSAILIERSANALQNEKLFRACKREGLDVIEINTGILALGWNRQIHSLIESMDGSINFAWIGSHLLNPSV